MWAIQHFHFDYPGQLLTSGGFGTMGFGLGAAIGAQVSHPDMVVLHITGDGGFRMNCNELATEQYYNLPIINIVFNNGTLGMVRQWQTLISTSTMKPQRLTVRLISSSWRKPTGCPVGVCATSRSWRKPFRKHSSAVTATSSTA